MKSERSAQTSEYFDAVGCPETSLSTEEEKEMEYNAVEDAEMPTVITSAAEDKAKTKTKTSTSRPNNLYMAKKLHTQQRLHVSKEPPALHKLPKKNWKLEDYLFSITGVIFILGGIAWSVAEYVTIPRYEPVTTGIPIKAVNCHNRTTLTEMEQTKCLKYLRTGDRACRLAVTYNYTIDDEEDFIYTGTDLRKYPRDENDLCLDDEPIATYLALQNITVWYDPADPTDSITYEEPSTPEGMAALIAGLCCGFGLCFAFPLWMYCCDFCCVLNDNRRIKRHWKEWENQQQEEGGQIVEGDI